MKLSELLSKPFKTKGGGNVDLRGLSKRVVDRNIGGGDAVQSDWDEDNTESLAYIKNKPTIPAPYSLPTATKDTLGGIKLGETLKSAGDGVVDVKVPVRLVYAVVSTGKSIEGFFTSIRGTPISKETILYYITNGILYVNLISLYDATNVGTAIASWYFYTANIYVCPHPNVVFTYDLNSGPTPSCCCGGGGCCGGPGGCCGC